MLPYFDVFRAEMGPWRGTYQSLANKKVKITSSLSLIQKWNKSKSF